MPSSDSGGSIKPKQNFSLRWNPLTTSWVRSPTKSTQVLILITVICRLWFLSSAFSSPWNVLFAKLHVWCWFYVMFYSSYQLLVLSTYCLLLMFISISKRKKSPGLLLAIYLYELLLIPSTLPSSKRPVHDDIPEYLSATHEILLKPRLMHKTAAH